MASASNRWRADTSLRDRQGRTCLHYACLSANIECITQLVEAGSLVDDQDSLGETAVFFANEAKIVDLLVRNGAEIDHANQHALTPLGGAIQRSVGVDAIACFISLGANANAIDNYGNDGFAHAICFNHHEALRVLLDASKSCVRLNPYNCHL